MYKKFSRLMLGAQFKTLSLSSELHPRGNQILSVCSHFILYLLDRLYTARTCFQWARLFLRLIAFKALEKSWETHQI